MEENKYLLFGPQNETDLRRQYPDLWDVEEFVKLSVGEMLFVWWFANPTSPLIAEDNLPDKNRSIKAYEKAFKSHPDENRKTNYYSLNFPDKIRLAIDRMKKFEPSVRIRGKMMLEKIMKNFESMIEVNMDDFKVKDDEGKSTGEIDFTARNNYVNSAKTIIQALPDLVSQVEQGFGVKDKGKEIEGEKAIDRFHKSILD